MNKFVKAGVGAALALGAVAAHATMTVPTSSTTTDTSILFVDVFNGTSFVKAYVGDTGTMVSTTASGTQPSNFSDPTLTSFLSTYATSGTTVYWALEGINNYGNAPQAITSSPTKTPLNGTSGGALNSGGINFHGEMNAVNALTPANANSKVLSSDAQGVGSGFNPFPQGNGDVSNWYNSTGAIYTTGLNTQSVIYSMVASDVGGATLATLTPLFDASLTSTGLVFTPMSAVPIPAALWLLGSGLLGLAGVARRKVAAA